MVAFGTADVAAATAEDICFHWSWEDSNRVLKVSGVGTLEEEETAALAVCCGTVRVSVAIPAIDTEAGAGTLDGDGCWEGTRVLAMLLSLA